MSDIKLPLHVSLMLENKYLDIALLLQILCSFKYRRAGLSLEEIAYYYSLVESTMCNGNECTLNYTYLQNRYIDIMEKLKKILLALENNSYVEVAYNIKKEELKFTINSSMEESINAFGSRFLKDNLEKISFVKNNYEFTPANKNIVWRNY